MSGYVKLYRQIKDSEIWKEPPEVFKLFQAILLNARHQTKPAADGTARGQLRTTWDKLAADVGITRPTVAKGLDRLTALGMITVEAERRTGSLITVINYDKYQAKKDSQKSTRFTNGDTQSDSQKSTRFTTVVNQIAHCGKPGLLLAKENPSIGPSKTPPKNVKNVKNVDIDTNVSTSDTENVELSEALLDDQFVEVKTKKPRRPRAQKSSVPKPDKKAYAEAVLLTEEEHGKLVSKFGAELTAYYIEAVNAWKLSNPDKLRKSDYGVIHTFELKDRKAGRNPLLNNTLKRQPYMTQAQKNDAELDKMLAEFGITRADAVADMLGMPKKPKDEWTNIIDAEIVEVKSR